MEFLRCPKCSLIPRIIQVNYENKKFMFRYFCPNNHTETIFYKNMKKYDLNEIKCNECKDINNKSLYYCRECYNIICKKCIKIHQEKQIHKNIIDINVIDDICYIHNEINILYCKTCEESICNKCIKSKKHKEHDINELKFLDLINLKKKCIKFRNKLSKNLEEYKLRLFKQRKNEKLNDFKDNKEIKLYIKELKNINIDIVDFILDMINDFDKYKKFKKFPNYLIYLNCKLISKYISDGYTYFGKWREKLNCKNYQTYKSLLLKDEIEDNKFFSDKNLVSETIIKIRNIYSCDKIDIEYCYFYMNEKGEGIIIYLNKNILCYKNIETLEDFKKIEINNISIKKFSSKYLICCKKEYLLLYNYYGSFEVFMIENDKSIKINSNIKKKDITQQEQDFFDRQFLLCSINYFNKNIYVSCFYKNKIYIYNILLNQVEIVMNFNEAIMFSYNKYFLNNKNVYDFLFVTTEKECCIYSIKKFSLKKKLLLQNVYYVLLSEISNKDCLIISYDENLIIKDFFSDDILFKTYAGKTQCLFLWNQNTIFENSQDCSCANNSIYDLFDDEYKNVWELRDFWWADEIYKIELKKYGKCLLRIGENKINLFHIKTEEEIKKEKEKYEEMQ